eukprot:m.82165 g.82165  ORF g.82165 m.82165 type:complete len:845 (-) comp19539_c0_seq2:472-3006(-)
MEISVTIRQGRGSAGGAGARTNRRPMYLGAGGSRGRGGGQVPHHPAAHGRGGPPKPRPRPGRPAPEPAPPGTPGRPSRRVEDVHSREGEFREGVVGELKPSTARVLAERREARPGSRRANPDYSSITVGQLTRHHLGQGVPPTAAWVHVDGAQGGRATDSAGGGGQARRHQVEQLRLSSSESSPHGLRRVPSALRRQRSHTGLVLRDTRGVAAPPSRGRRTSTSVPTPGFTRPAPQRKTPTPTTIFNARLPSPRSPTFREEPHHPLDESATVTARRNLRASPDRRDPVAGAVQSFMPKAGYLEVIESVRTARRERARKRQEAAQAEQLKADEAIAEGERRAKEVARLLEESAETRKRQAMAIHLDRERQLEEFRAQVERRAKLERERRQRCAEEERRAKYGPLSCTADDVGITVIRHQNLRGVEISEVAAGSLADKAGLVATDVIVEVNSRSVLNAKCSRVVGVMNRCDALLRLRVARRDAVTNLAKPPASGIRTVLLKRPRAAIICTEITPQTLHHAADYYELNLAGTGLTEVPRSIEAFLNVEVLDLADNNIDRLPDDISKLRHLKRLDCSSNRLVALPDSIGGLSELTSLYLFEEKLLKVLPDSIGGLEALVTLNIPRNALTELPESINNLRNLQSLWASDNALTALPDMSKMSSLTKLVLDDNPFERMPDTIQHFTELKTLTMMRCKIPEIPRWIGNLKALTRLNLNGNDLVDLPDTIGELTELLVLDVGRNQLRELPASCAHLTKLEELYIEANRLEFLPKALFELSAFVHGLGHLRKVRFGFVPGHTCQSIHCCGALLSQRLEGGAGALSNDPEYDSDTDSDTECDGVTTDGHVSLGT